MSIDPVDDPGSFSPCHWRTDDLSPPDSQICMRKRACNPSSKKSKRDEEGKKRETMHLKYVAGVRDLPDPISRRPCILAPLSSRLEKSAESTSCSCTSSLD